MECNCVVRSKMMKVRNSLYEEGVISPSGPGNNGIRTSKRVYRTVDGPLKPKVALSIHEHQITIL